MQVQTQLVKAKLLGLNGEAPTIELMFNPTQISFTRTANWTDDPGVSGTGGKNPDKGRALLPKVNFSSVTPYKFTLSKLLFDTYETKKSVMEEHINKIKTGVEAPVEAADGSGRRPPVYIFTWDKNYFHCVMTSLTYELTMFLPDGTPVRAIVDIALQEVDGRNSPGGRDSASTGKDRVANPDLD